MVEPVSLIIGGGLILVGYAAGRVGRRRGQAATTPRVEYICGCTHQFAFHDPASGRCHGKMEEPTEFSMYGSVVAYKMVPCTCRRYDGTSPPEAIDWANLQLPGLPSNERSDTD